MGAYLVLGLTMPGASQTTLVVCLTPGQAMVGLIKLYIAQMIPPESSASSATVLTRDDLYATAIVLRNTKHDWHQLSQSGQTQIMCLLLYQQ